MQRRDFIKYLGCGCCAFIVPSCSSTPITKRKQLKIYPESTINANAAKAYASFKKKAKMSKDIATLNMVKRIGAKWKKQFLFTLKIKI